VIEPWVSGGPGQYHRKDPPSDTALSTRLRAWVWRTEGGAWFWCVWPYGPQSSVTVQGASSTPDDAMAAADAALAAMEDM
jgi:hypothetical protein